MPVFSLTLIPNSSQPSRLDQFLEATLPNELKKRIGEVLCSRSKIRRLIIAGAVKINSVREHRPARNISTKDTVIVTLDTQKFLFEKKPEDFIFEMTESSILFEDEHLIIVNKPSGIPTEATIVSSRDHLHAVLKRYLQQRDETRNEPYVGLHHRLDRETSGVILFSKTRTVNAAVHELFLNQNIVKKYNAFAISPKNKKLSINAVFSVENKIGRLTSKSSRGKWGAVEEEGDIAITDFSILETYSFFNHIQVMPRTGRTHQIRVHLAGLDMPILGDTLYEGPQSFPSGETISRICLHASSITFPHPVSNEVITVSAPLPQEMKKILEESSRIL